MPEKDGHARPEGGGDGRAVEQGWVWGFGPPAGGEEQGGGEGSGEEPAGVVAERHAVVGAAFRPNPEAQGGGAGVEDGVHPDEEQGGEDDVEEARRVPHAAATAPTTSGA